MTAEQRNILNYALLALGAFLLGCATALVPQLMDPSVPPLNWRIVLGTGITALVTAYGGALLPRQGSTNTARQEDDLREQGYHRRDLTVVPKADAEPDLGAIVDVPKVFPEAPAHLVFHDSPEGHIAFLTTAVPTPGAEMAEGEAFHVADHRPFAPDADKRYRCDSCDRVLDHVAAVAGEWVATGREGAP